MAAKEVGELVILLGPIIAYAIWLERCDREAMSDWVRMPEPRPEPPPYQREINQRWIVGSAIFAINFGLAVLAS